MTNDPILLVEDDDNDVYFMKRAFQRSGVTNPIHVAEDGQKAVDYLSGTGLFADRQAYPIPGLVLLDLRLPFVPGLDLLQWIRSHAELKTLVVVVLTSSKEDADIAQAYLRGANAYLVKPSDAEKLLSLVQDIRDFWLKQNEPPPRDSEAGAA